MISLPFVGTCLDFAAENRRVTEQNAALEKMSADVETLWSDPRRWTAIVLLQDRAQHIGESVDGCSLQESSHDYALCYASSQSSACNFPTSS
jgi:hypothetical protein